MHKLLHVALIALLICAAGPAEARAGLFKSKKKKAAKEQLAAEKSDSTENKGKKAYEKLLKDAKTYKGMFNVHVVKDKYYFEIPKNILHRDYLLASRVSSISNNKDIAAGQMPRSPIHITFSADEKNVYIHKKRTTTECDTTSNMYQAFVRNYIDPIWNAYKIEAMNPDSTAYVIDITDLFVGDVPELSPFRESNIWDVLMRKKPLTGSLSSSKSSIIGVKAFPQNINIKSQLTYNADGAFTATLTRNIIMLPEKPMRPRYYDPRVGYFAESRNRYTEEEDGIKEYEIINRWDIQPKPEDLERYKRGELVEPAKPIVYYVDPAIPEKWRKYIKLGIEDWQKAFEGCDTTASFIRMTLRGADGKKVLSDEVFYPVYPKEQRLPKAEISCRKVKKGGVMELTLKSRVLARDVFVEVPLQGARFSDNFFDLLPGETKRITVSSADGSPLEDISVVIHQLADVMK